MKHTNCSVCVSIPIPISAKDALPISEAEATHRAKAKTKNT
jgi:hypothetical protein